MTPYHRQPGFALLITLLMVMLLGAVLAGIAWLSTTGAIQAQDDLDELQRRWAVTSGQANLLPLAEKLFSTTENSQQRQHPRDPNAPLTTLRVTCELANRPYELLFTDEQAKLNVNTLLDDHANANDVVTKLSRPSYPVTVQIRTEPRTQSPKPLPTTPSPPSVQTYGQLFTRASPAQLSSALTASITCWGSGAVNYRRASDAVLTQACARILGPASLAQFLKARRLDPSCELAVLLGRLDSINQQQKEQLRHRLTDQSGCHGLWIIARGQQRAWYTLAIDEKTAPATNPDPQPTTQPLPPSRNPPSPATRPADRRLANPDFQFAW